LIEAKWFKFVARFEETSCTDCSPSATKCPIDVPKNRGNSKSSVEHLRRDPAPHEYTSTRQKTGELFTRMPTSVTSKNASSNKKTPLCDSSIETTPKIVLFYRCPSSAPYKRRSISQENTTVRSVDIDPVKPSPYKFWPNVYKQMVPRFVKTAASMISFTGDRSFNCHNFEDQQAEAQPLWTIMDGLEHSWRILELMELILELHRYRNKSGLKI
jgi:hypothetical protein